MFGRNFNPHPHQLQLQLLLVANLGHIRRKVEKFCAFYIHSAKLIAICELFPCHYLGFGDCGGQARHYDLRKSLWLNTPPKVAILTPLIDGSIKKLGEICWWFDALGFTPFGKKNDMPSFQIGTIFLF